MSVLVACKNEEDRIKIEDTRVVTALFIDFSDAQGQLTLKAVMESCLNSSSSKLLWLVLISGRMKKIHLKKNALEWSQHFPIKILSWVFFSDAHGQLTPEFKVRSGRITNPSDILWLSSLPARIKKIRFKMNSLEWSQWY